MAATNSTVVSNDTDKLLQELNDKLAMSMIPVLVYLSILLVVGLIGNAMVVFYYGCKTRRTSNSVFICMVAVFDLLSCCLSIPIEMVDLRFFYMFTNSGLCKVLRFVNHMAAIGSALTLLMIAADRFRRICKPFKKQLTLGQSKIVCLVTVVVALVLSTPAFVFYQSVKSDLINEDGILLEGCDCTTTRDKAYQPYFYAFHGTYLLLFVISTIILFTIYSIIGRVLYKHSQFRNRYMPRESSMTSPSEVALKSKNTADDMNTKTKTYVDADANENIDSSKGVELRNNVRNDVMSMKIKNSVDINSHDKFHPDHLDMKTIKYTLVMLVITVVFVLSFLPYLCLIVYKTFQDDFRSYDSSVVFQIGIRSYFLNAALNPITYGFFNSKFRNFFFMKLCPCCKEKLDIGPHTSSSAG